MRRGSLLTAKGLTPEVFGWANLNDVVQGHVAAYRVTGASHQSPRTGILTRVEAVLTTNQDNMQIFTINPTTRVVTAVSAVLPLTGAPMDVSPNIAINAGDIVGIYGPGSPDLCYGYNGGSLYYYNSAGVPAAASTQAAWTGNVSANPLMRLTVL